MTQSARWPRIRRRVIVLVLFWVCVLLSATVWLKLKSGTSTIPARIKQNPPEGASIRATPPDAPKAGHPAKAPPEISAPPDGIASPGPSSVTDADLDYIASKNLLIPVAGVGPNQLRDTFSQARSEGRRHDAIDIMAPQGTPVVATTDGSISKLFRSDRGGITLYELDPSGNYVYYYAHLMSYADGITEGKQLRRGDVIAYVGDTGNAGIGQFHLHFAISKISSRRQWSGGDPINPYPLLVRR